jgi:hypothetical protein
MIIKEEPGASLFIFVYAKAGYKSQQTASHH